MQLDLVNTLQTLLLPLAVGTVVVAGALVLALRRKPAKPAALPAQASTAQPSPTLAARTPAPSATVANLPAARVASGATPAAVPAALPAATPSASAPTTPVAAAVASSGPSPAATALPLRADLLLVDDSAVVRAKLRRLFEPAGYRVALAHDGAAALALLQAGRYAVLITDLEMPKLDGMGLIHATLALPTCAGMPILAITGHDDLQAQLNQLGAVAGIYRKPWSDETLLDHVQALARPSRQVAEPVAQQVAEQVDEPALAL